MPDSSDQWTDSAVEAIGPASPGGLSGGPSTGPPLIKPLRLRVTTAGAFFGACPFLYQQIETNESIRFLGIFEAI